MWGRRRGNAVEAPAHAAMSSCRAESRVVQGVSSLGLRALVLTSAASACWRIRSPRSSAMSLAVELRSVRRATIAIEVGRNREAASHVRGRRRTPASATLWSRCWANRRRRRVRCASPPRCTDTPRTGPGRGPGGSSAGSSPGTRWSAWAGSRWACRAHRAAQHRRGTSGCRGCGRADVLLVAGGDVLYLCHWMRESGLTDLLPSLKETRCGWD